MALVPPIGCPYTVYGQPMGVYGYVRDLCGSASMLRGKRQADVLSRRPCPFLMSLQQPVSLSASPAMFLSHRIRCSCSHTRSAHTHTPCMGVCGTCMGARSSRSTLRARRWQASRRTAAPVTANPRHETGAVTCATSSFLLTQAGRFCPYNTHTRPIHALTGASGVYGQRNSVRSEYGDDP